MRKVDWVLILVVIFVIVLAILSTYLEQKWEYKQSEIARLVEERVCKCECRVSCIRWVSPEQQKILSSLCDK